MRAIIFVLTLFVSATSFSAEENGSSGGEVEYFSLDPKFVINLKGRKRYMRADVQLMVEGDSNVDKIRTHSAPLRHELIMLFSEYGPDELATAEQREQLRVTALNTVRGVLEKHANPDGLRNLFFSEFLVH